MTRLSDYEVHNPPPASAVLLSGGLDSAVLVAEEAARHPVHPLYVNVGLSWEEPERRTIERLLQHAAFSGRVRPLVSLTLDMADIYSAGHWAIEGRPPEYHTPDEDVYLPGRNIVLLGKAAMFCASVGVHRIVLGTLAHNPFPDATPEFRSAIARALSLGLAHEIAIATPFAEISKAEVIRRGQALGVPFELTLSCMSPRSGGDRESIVHCGVCSKCRERHDAFVEAGVPDPTAYADISNVGGR